MQRKLLGLLAVAATTAAVAMPASAQAYNCHSWRCVNQALNKMQKQANTNTRFLSALATCMGEVPVNQYGDPGGSFGYAFTNDGVTSLYTTALDVVPTGDSVDAWMFTDTCNTSKANTIRQGRRALARGFGREVTLTPQHK